MQIDQRSKKDFVILGAGMTGLSLAYWLLKEKENSITIIDRMESDAASRRNAGFITSGSITYYNFLLENFGPKKAERLWKFSKENIRGLAALIKNENIDCSFYKGGSYTLSVDKCLALPGKISLRENLPGFDGHNVYFDPEEMSYDPMEFVHQLKKMLISKGIEFVQDNITSIDELKQKVKAKRYFIATNSAFVKNVAIIPQRAQASKFKIKTNLKNANYYLPSEKIYFRILNNDLYIGGKRLVDAQSEQTSNLGINKKIQGEIKNFVKKYIDPTAKLVDQWSGIMGFHENGHPIVYRSPLEDYVFLGGYSGHGNGYAFNLAKKTVQATLAGDFADRTFLDFKA